MGTENSIKLDLASSPHIHSRWSTKTSMWMVVAALVPSVISALVFFGVYQLVVMAVAVGFAVGTEAVLKKIRGQEVTIWDGSGVITGLLLALILPPNFALTSTALGSIVAIVLGKEIFGGLGYNIFNPALVGRAFLQAAFPVPMTTWSKTSFAVDATSSATPLASSKFESIFANVTDMLVGNTGGCMGETSSIAVLIGGIFLIAVGIVNWRVPLSMAVGVIVFGGLIHLIDPTAPTPLYHLFAGGFMFGALFMASDWVTSPITAKGTWYFGLGIALIIVLIRVYGGLPEGVMYAILFMNALTPLINRYTRPRLFGEVK